MGTATQGRRPSVSGKFLFLGEQKFLVRGVTYGTFRPRQDGVQYPPPDRVELDFRQIAASGFNSVRTYTVPPVWLLDLALQHSLHVMIGLPWEQHVTFLDDDEQAARIEQSVRNGTRSCAGHPAVLCYVIGNEIPASIVRWHGARRVERFLKRLYRAVKDEDPEGLVTYVNYPTTEYLQLRFVDFCCFNVYLENRNRLEAYLARLQNIAGDRPLVIAEIGLDSRRHGEEAQALVLDWQIRTILASGCAGLFIFAWTDEWSRGGYDIDDWDFGLTRRDRQPKRSLDAVCCALADTPFSKNTRWPKVSVVVCTYNGSRTIEETMRGLAKLDYADFEVIVVNDGSNDRTGAIINGFDVRYVETENRGLSAARNTGLNAATGEIVAYIDDDAYPDGDWLKYLAAKFMESDFAAVGGPNIPPPGDGHIADCVANAPGGPVHVLLTDQVAEHIPGCNMAFRRADLLAIGGFDPQFRVAGDDVDVCWRLQQNGRAIGFCSAAVVWHHRRNSARTYWKQQVGYGRAEALLAKKWPEKYCSAGKLNWSGRLYGNGLTAGFSLFRQRIYHGVWGSALFQSLYEPAPSVLAGLTSMPGWYLLTAALLVLALLGFKWQPLLGAFPLLLFSAVLPLVHLPGSVQRASFTSRCESDLRRAGKYLLTAVFHVIQPSARLLGRVKGHLALRPREGNGTFALPHSYQFNIWSEEWQSADSWLTAIEDALQSQHVFVARGGVFDRWDLEVHCGLFGRVRARMAIEEHGEGKQLVRLKAWPRVSCVILAVFLGLGALATWAGIQGQATICALLGTMSAGGFLLVLQNWSGGIQAFRGAVLPAEHQTPARVPGQGTRESLPQRVMPEMVSQSRGIEIERG